MRIQGTVVSGRKRNECPPCAKTKHAEKLPRLTYNNKI